MSFKYSQSTGVLTHDEGGLIGTGYSGHGDGVNNPEMQNVVGIGPVPQGLYTIQPPTEHPKLGRLAMALLPSSENTMFGRSAFFMHGDNSAANHTASEGCIIMAPVIRNAVASAVASGDNQLEVVA